MAAAEPPAEIDERRLLAPAPLGGERTAGREDAAGRRRAGHRGKARNGVEPRRLLAAFRPWQAAQQADRIGVARRLEQASRRPLLDEPPGIKHAGALAQPGDDRQIVADEQDGGIELEPQLLDEVQHLGLDRHIESGRRLVEDEQRRIARQRHGDRHPLLHAARQLMRVALHHPSRIGNAHPVEHLGAAGQCFLPRHAAKREDLGNLASDADRRVERPAGILVNHGDRRLPQRPELRLPHAHQVLAVDP